MSNREMDRILRERLEHFEQEAPMHVWERIAAARAEGKRPASPWLWWSGGFGVLALTAAVALWLLLGQTSWTPGAPEQPANQGQAIDNPMTDDCPTATASAPQVKMESPQVFQKQKQKQETQVSKAAFIPEIPAGSEMVEAEVESGSTLVQYVSSFEGLKSGEPGIIDWKYGRNQAFPEISCNAFGKELWKLNLYVEAVGSPEYVFRSLGSKSQEFADYAGSRDKMEEVRGGFTTGVRLSAVTNFGVSVRTGIQYGQINEVLNYRDPNDFRMIVTNVYDQLGNIIGTDTTFQAGTHRVVSYNRYRMLDVPLMAGYEFQFPRFSMAVHGGVYFNLLFAQKGKILGPDGEPVGVTSGTPNAFPAFKDELGMSLAGSIGFNYRLTPDIQFIVEPQFRIILDPVTRAAYPLKQDYFLTGVTMGVRKNL